MDTSVQTIAYSILEERITEKIWQGLYICAQPPLEI